MFYWTEQPLARTDAHTNTKHKAKRNTMQMSKTNNELIV